MKIAPLQTSLIQRDTEHCWSTRKKNSAYSAVNVELCVAPCKVCPRRDTNTGRKGVSHEETFGHSLAWSETIAKLWFRTLPQVSHLLPISQQTIRTHAKRIRQFIDTHNIFSESHLFAFCHDPFGITLSQFFNRRV